MSIIHALNLIILLVFGQFAGYFLFTRSFFYFRYIKQYLLLPIDCYRRLLIIVYG